MWGRGWVLEGIKILSLPINKPYKWGDKIQKIFLPPLTAILPPFIPQLGR
jgi:hypothetical protein